MGELILCRQPIAATPYYIEEKTLNIYSLEELSYYIYHNVYLINHDFMNVDLCNFIGRELGMKEFQSELLDMVEKNRPLHEFVEQILLHSGYLTASEIKETIKIIATFENKSESECKKMRADRLMEQGRFVDAIYEYENILEKETDSTINSQLLGDIWHNLSTAYARLFFFTEAAEGYRRAYELNHKVVSLKGMLLAFRCNHNEAGYEEAVKRYYVTPDALKQIDHLIMEMQNTDEIKSFDHKLDELYNSYAKDELMNTIETTMDSWKSDYALYCRI